MGNLSIRRVSVILLVLVLVQSFFLLAKGGLQIHQHEVDTLHLIDILVRMHGGEIPHLDFMTPIGVLAFAPVVIFMKAGLSVGMALMAAQVLIAVLLFPAVIYIIHSRMTGWIALGFGVAVFTLILSLIHGGTGDVTSVSMHYNRWAWAVAFLVISVGFLPVQGQGSDLADGVITGLGFAILALIKVTYFAAFALPVALGFLLRRQYKALVVSVISGLLVALIVTLLAGVSFWQAYLDDLLTVARSDLRPFPGVSFGETISSPAYLAGSACLMLAVMLLRKAGQAQVGLLLLTLAPGFFYVTWQNYGNDPQWLLLLPLLIAMRLPQVPEDAVLWQWKLRDMLRVTVIFAIALMVPGFVNLANSPLRHLLSDRAEFGPLAAGDARYDDVLLATARLENVEYVGDLYLGEAFPVNQSDDDEDAVVLNGEVLATCNLSVGVPAWQGAMAAALTDGEIGEDARIFVADLSSSIWLYGPFGPVPGAAPWQYGDLAGLENATHLMVPLCPTLLRARKSTLEGIAARGVTLDEVQRNNLLILFEMQHPAGGTAG